MRGAHLRGVHGHLLASIEEIIYYIAYSVNKNRKRGVFGFGRILLCGCEGLEEVLGLKRITLFFELLLTLDEV